jgi:hydroxyethylthiazole kinase-like uncharacterized protein yjeF
MQDPLFLIYILPNTSMVCTMNLDELREFRETGLVTPERMRVIEENAAALGVVPLMMMESAGVALASAVMEHQPERVLLLCGKGNNGADGMVAARYLQHQVETEVVIVSGESMSDLTALQLSILQACNVTLHPIRCAAEVRELDPLFLRADMIVDALLGTGAFGIPREPVASLVERANRADVPILSVDAPTSGLRAGRILAFHRPKVEGSEVVEIGIPLLAEVCTGPGDLTLISEKSSHAHKGSGGAVLVVGGGPYQGAPYLTGLAALRAGADVVHIASPVSLPYPDLIHVPLNGTHITKEHLPRILPLAERADVVICGNGLGAESHDLVLALAPSCRRLVLDADALRSPLPEGKETIYTPHAGEFQRMTGADLPEDLAAKGKRVQRFASHGVILLKGEVDIISDGKRVRFNLTGCPAMTVGGTGDILAGVTGALFCRMPAFEAACAAAYANGLNGEEVAEKRGDGLLASDLLDNLPGVLFGGE